ncbi:MAG: hypothetical protein HYV63_21275 [Candidatus Schekmanbacteria bacterium]|nr:hypothetical protein [Candidatus Schekmanbacteria bacterium]
MSMEVQAAPSPTTTWPETGETQASAETQSASAVQVEVPEEGGDAGAVGRTDSYEEVAAPDSLGIARAGLEGGANGTSATSETAERPDLTASIDRSCAEVGTRLKSAANGTNGNGVDPSELKGAVPDTPKQALPDGAGSGFDPALATHGTGDAKPDDANLSPVQKKIKEEAEKKEGSIDPSQTGADGKPKGWDELKKTYEEATGQQAQDKESYYTKNPQGKLKPDGRDWCGIWATKTLRDAGVDARWNLGGKDAGKMTGDVTRVDEPQFTNPKTYKEDRAKFEKSVQVGDVIVEKNYPYHHSVVTKVNENGTVETMSGNTEDRDPKTGRLRSTAVVASKSRRLKDVAAYYRPNKSGQAQPAQS